MHYPSQGDFFDVPETIQEQGSVLMLSGTALPNVTSRIVAKSDGGRSSSAGAGYGTIVLKFFVGDVPYTFESGNYSIIFDIIAGDYHHKSLPGSAPFAFVVQFKN